MTPDLRTALPLLRAAPRLSPEALAARQAALLRRLVLHAATHVPFYRRRFAEAGVRPEDVRTAADLRRLPTVSKADLRAVPTAERTAAGVDPARLIPFATSGSSGEPLPVSRTWLEQNLLHLYRLRALHRLGQRPTDRIVSIVRRHHAHANDNKLLGRALRAAGVHRKTWISPDQPAEAIVAELAERRPDLVVAYPATLMRVAGAMDDAARRRIRPRFLWCGAEVLLPAVRRAVGEAFAAPLYDLYSCAEAYSIATECRAGTLHTVDDAVLVEVLCGDRPAEPGERGEVVITALHSYALPFVRYRLGDLVERRAPGCACGQPFGAIGQVHGRTVDFFTLPGGRVVHPFQFVSSLLNDEHAWVRRFQLVQERTDHVVLHIAAAEPPPADALARVRAALAPQFGAGVAFDIETHETIPDEASGKFRPVRSKVSSLHAPGVAGAPGS